ncbi:KAT8 regulatory NSL complex subunit 1 isoform X1 [Sinocyclocheilus rhinocerous]|uniref:KAT8 regulatory NSL complex subunit 1-like n=1 Tax=Sinocyclocheilus rhinocerous TaxID=307959 RepID=A0A673GAA1_9TELE|nr:PREDICTED: KAT8 regulatory NSL complex subunit 1-like isoform X1 [Sinocyclocheilus rhinocerous]XP_016368811.1 PREDICTED: KAT8 regulatory NSL complex subunit 1-like isoform X1 [Sinocyclocheilus rhinocerous]XP_016368812.1 PREDICTED: KAT8 regulatory NSL complex subunit 1-like isoform X1 [Sinocyclocheilus rhinocerous]
MAAMAPALTDAPAEARHIRFKLASPSSTLSPGSTENNSNASNILISDSVSDSAGSHTNGKCHINADDGQNFAHYHSVKGQEQDPLSKAPSLGKLAPYLCSDVKPLPSSTKVKESLKLQGVLIKQSVLKSHGLLSSSIFPSAAAGSDFLLRKRHALELTGGQLKSLVNGTGAGSTMVPVNRLSKKVAVPSAAVAEKGSVATVNGDSNQPSTNGEALLSVSSKSVGTFATGGQNGDVKPQQNLTPSIQGVSSQRELTALSESAEVNAEPESPVDGMVVETNSNNVVDCPSSLSSSPVHDDSSLSTPNLEALLWDRAQQSQHRQTDIEGRLLRLRKRLQVVQAKQVERHFKQQLAGFVDRTLTPTSSRRADPGAWRGSRASVGTHAHNLSRFLKGGRVALELDQLHLSGTTHLRATEAQFDSDATESSSGGESDIEEEELTRADVDQRHIKLWRRAEGRFARERATIISHWTWLQAQISDLEYRIRQQVDIYRQLRASKGLVELGDSVPSCQRTETNENVLTSATSHNFTESQSRLTDTSENDISVSSVTEMSGTCPSNLDSSCTSARTRPLLTCRRRRLIHPNTVHNLNGKVQRVSFSPLCVCEVNGSCVMCGGAPPLSKPDLPFDRPLLERVAHQDCSIHPILSMQSDVALSLQLQKVLRSHWQTRPFDRIKPLKKISLKHKLSITPSSSSSFLSKHKFRLSNPHAAAVRLARHKSRSERLHRQRVDNISCVPKPDTLTPCRPDRVLDRSHSRKRVREHSLDRADSPKVVMDAGSPCPSLSSLHSSNTSPLTRQLSLPVESSTPLGNSVPIRRRRGESPFDINNIVIPMSVAATTRVEKLQYKEILTPRWREVDILAKPLAEEDTNIPVEDLSDATFTKLHQPLEEQERSRWRWTALAPGKRRGSRSYKSLDGRTTPSIVGTNPSTPQPSSPDASHFHILQDYGPVPSPLSPPSPDTPCSRDAHTPHTRDTHRLLYSEDTCGSTSDCTFEETMVQPWEHRSFPLSEDPIVEPEMDKNQLSFPTGLRDNAHCRAESESDASSP